MTTVDYVVLIAFYMFFLGLGFSAVGKTCAPLIDAQAFRLPWRPEPVPIEFIIAVGGGPARTQTSARVGLVGGVFMKRLCSVGWALTALIVPALMADNVEIAEAPDSVRCGRTEYVPFNVWVAPESPVRASQAALVVHRR